MDTKFQQYFNSTKGIQAVDSPLTTDPQQFQSLCNMQFGKGLSLEGRSGVKQIGQLGRFSHVHNYSFLDTTTGESRSEILAFNSGLWRLTRHSIGIVPLSYTTWTWRMRFDSILLAYIFEVVVNGAVVFTRNLGNGLGTGIDPCNVTVSVGALNNALVGSGLFTITSTNTPNGQHSSGVNTNYVGPNPTLPLLVGHSYFQGTRAVLWSPTRVDNANSILPGGRLVDAEVIQATAGAIQVRYPGDIFLFGNQLLGVDGFPAATAIVPLNPPEANQGQLQIPVYCWRRVRCPLELRSASTTNIDKFDLFSDWYIAQQRNLSTDLPSQLQAENAAQTCYVLAPTTKNTEPYSNRLFKYDSRFVYRAGMPRGVINSVTQPGSGGASTFNTVRLIAVPKYTDFRGIVVNGQASVVFRYNPPVNTLSIAPTVVVPSINHDSGYNTAGAQVNGAGQTLPGAITVQSGHMLSAGDRVTLTYETGLGSITANGTVASTGFTTVTINDISTSGNALTNGSWIGSGIVWEVYRTQPNGTVFWKVGEAANQPQAATTTVTLQGFLRGLPIDDIFVTTNLLRYEEPIAGFEPGEPPPAKVMTLHDGALVLAQGVNEPNSLYWSLPGQNEAFPPLNNLVVPSDQLGGISAAISGGSGDLNIFKQTAWYKILGSLADRNVGVEVKSSGDWGISCPGALTKIDGQVWGVGSLGISTYGQERSSDAADYINSLIENNENLDFNNARLINDRLTQTLHIYIPGRSVNITRDKDNNTNNFYVVMDYDKGNVWFDRAYPRGLRPSSGLAIWNDALGAPWNKAELYMCSGGQANNPSSDGIAPGRIYQRLNITNNPRDNFVDHFLPIKQEIITNPIHYGDPSTDKLFLQLKSWAFWLKSEVAKFIPFTWIIRTYREYQDTIIDTQATVPTNAITEYEKVVDLNNQSKTRALTIQWTCETLHQQARLTGFEVNIRNPYIQSNFKK
jgi:hypothetical protein